MTTKYIKVQSKKENASPTDIEVTDNVITTLIDTINQEIEMHGDDMNHYLANRDGEAIRFVADLIDAIEFLKQLQEATCRKS